MSINPDPVLKPTEAGEYVNAAPQAMKRWRLRGEGPRHIRRGPRVVVYRKSDLDAWLNARTFDSYAAEKAGQVEAV